MLETHHYVNFLVYNKSDALFGEISYGEFNLIDVYVSGPRLLFDRSVMSYLINKDTF